VLFYPTAIGSEPPNPSYSSYPHWARVMQGHAGANMVRPPGPPGLRARARGRLVKGFGAEGRGLPRVQCGGRQSPELVHRVSLPSGGCRSVFWPLHLRRMPTPTLHSRQMPTPPHPTPRLTQLPVVASNRIGTEAFEHSHITFYGGSFIAGPSGEIVAQVGQAPRYGGSRAGWGGQCKSGLRAEPYWLFALQR
jgi:hypothetical protein